MQFVAGRVANIRRWLMKVMSPTWLPQRQLNLGLLSHNVQLPFIEPLTPQVFGAAASNPEGIQAIMRM